MWGFTERVSVHQVPHLIKVAALEEDGSLSLSTQGGGMGIPSVGIYATELFDDHGVRVIIRIGTCGALREDLPPGTMVLAQSASTDSGFLRSWFGDRTFAPSADPDLLFNARLAARAFGIRVHVCGTLSTDLFYDKEHPDAWKLWPQYGVDVVEMEAAMLYTLAARRPGCRALAILTVSDNLVTREHMTAEQRENCATGMNRLAIGALGHGLGA
jgi:purine-nucleoside phosphorylase